MNLFNHGDEAAPVVDLIESTVPKDWTVGPGTAFALLPRQYVKHTADGKLPDHLDGVTWAWTNPLGHWAIVLRNEGFTTRRRAVDVYGPGGAWTLHGEERTTNPDQAQRADMDVVKVALAMLRLLGAFGPAPATGQPLCKCPGGCGRRHASEAVPE